MSDDNKKVSAREIIGALLKFFSGALLLIVVLLGGCRASIIYDQEAYPNLPELFLVVVLILIGLYFLGSKLDPD
jgi:hypothetical protein